MPHKTGVIDNFVDGIANDHLQIAGMELVLGKIYDKIRFPTDGSCIAQNRKSYSKNINHSSKSLILDGF